MEREGIMPTINHGATPEPPPDWALVQATDELYDEPNPQAIADLARDIARDVQEREDERHDEYDDPDQGGEA